MLIGLFGKPANCRAGFNIYAAIPALLLELMKVERKPAIFRRYMELNEHLSIVVRCMCSFVFRVQDGECHSSLEPLWNARQQQGRQTLETVDHHRTATTYIHVWLRTLRVGDKHSADRPDRVRRVFTGVAGGAWTTGSTRLLPQMTCARAKCQL
jgi:hypothetical protein